MARDKLRRPRAMTNRKKIAGSRRRRKSIITEYEAAVSILCGGDNDMAILDLESVRLQQRSAFKRADARDARNAITARHFITLAALHL